MLKVLRITAISTSYTSYDNYERLQSDSQDTRTKGAEQRSKPKRGRQSDLLRDQQEQIQVNCIKDQ